MSLSTLALVASIISSIAVAASLVYLALQVHQNSKHARAQIQTGRVNRLIDQMVGFSDADKCAAYIKGNGGDPTPEAISARQFSLQCIAQVGVMFDNFTQHNDGLLSEEQFKGVTAIYQAWLREPGFREEYQIWRELTGSQSPAFTAYVDDLLSEPEQPTNH